MSGVREALEAGDVDALAEQLHPDVVFRSPAVYRPYHGRDTVVALLGVVAQVFENFRYAHEWRDGDTEILFFETNVAQYDSASGGIINVQGGQIGGSTDVQSKSAHAWIGFGLRFAVLL